VVEIAMSNWWFDIFFRPSVFRSMNVEECPGGVADIRDVQLALSQLPDQRIGRIEV